MDEIQSAVTTLEGSGAVLVAVVAALVAIAASVLVWGKVRKYFAAADYDEHSPEDVEAVREWAERQAEQQPSEDGPRWSGRFARGELRGDSDGGGI